MNFGRFHHPISYHKNKFTYTLERIFGSEIKFFKLTFFSLFPSLGTIPDKRTYKKTSQFIPLSAFSSHVLQISYPIKALSHTATLLHMSKTNFIY